MKPIKGYFAQLKRLLMLIKKKQPGFMVSGTLYALFTGITAFLSVRGAGIVLDYLQNQNGNNPFPMWVLICWAIGVCNIAFWGSKYESRIFGLFLKFVEDVSRTSMRIKYALTMDSDTLSLANKAQTAVCGTGIGIHKTLTGLSEIVQNLMGCILTGTILGECGLLLPCFCFFMILVVGYGNRKIAEITVRYKEKSSENQRKKYRMHMIMSDFSYGKDVRLLD